MHMGQFWEKGPKGKWSKEAPGLSGLAVGPTKGGRLPPWPHPSCGISPTWGRQGNWPPPSTYIRFAPRAFSNAPISLSPPPPGSRKEPR